MSRNRPDEKAIEDLVKAIAISERERDSSEAPALFSLIDISNAISETHDWWDTSGAFQKWFTEYFRSNEDSWRKAKGVIYRKEGPRSVRYHVVLSDENAAYCMIVDERTGQRRWVAWDTHESRRLLQALKAARK